MKIISTEDYLPGSVNDLWAYNGLDAMITVEVLDKISPMVNNNNASVYQFEMDCLAPALDMMRRGIKVNLSTRDEVTLELEKERARLQGFLNAISQAAFDKDLNPNSPKQLKDFFRRLGIPPVFIYDKGEKKESTNREALERIRNYYWAQIPVDLILAAREVGDKISVLHSGVDSDGRMRFSFNVGATETGRWSSSKNVYGGGTNGQNITDELRKIFESDEGYELGYSDLEQAESRVVAYTSKCPAYIDACESGDPHTSVAMNIWPKLGWSKDPKENRQIADQIYFRHFTYRDMAKRGGHATNYYGQPPTIAKHLKISKHIAEEFQHHYFTAFPEISQWHRKIAAELQSGNGSITTALGRERFFFGRLTDDATLREAIAYEPQSIVGDVLNKGLLNVYRNLPQIQLLAQVHDAILFQFNDYSLLPQMQKLMRVPVEFYGRTMVIPVETLVGKNWAKANANNPQGLKKWKAGNVSEIGKLG